MIEILKQWTGDFEIDGKNVDISNIKFNDGDEIDITLLPKVEVEK